MTEEKKNGTGMDWKRDMRELLRGLVGATKGRVEFGEREAGVRSREKELVGPSEARGMSGTEVGVEVEGVSIGAKLYDLEGQDLSGFGVGDLVELVPTAENRGMYPYLPVAGKVVGPNNRQEMFHLDGVKVGLVVRRGWKDTKKVFEESRSNENNRQADELLRRLEERGVVHGRAELLEVLIGSEEVVVEVLGPSCDTRRSFVVRKLVKEREEEEDER